MVGMSIAANLQQIQRAISAACTRFGRLEGDVKIVAVSKTKTIAMIDEAAATGQNIFAENYVQEAVEKISARPNLEWHFIGSLQTNKVKEIVGRVSLIHSVDRLKLLAEISKEALKKSITQDVLLQVHIGDEATKHGFSKEELFNDFASMVALSGVSFRGLMSMPPLSDDEAVSRKYFRELHEIHKNLRERLPSQKRAAFSYLSMGTTTDFVAAIAEGATHIRIGTAIFGERERKA
jgi:PLP dependent protein